MYAFPPSSISKVTQEVDRIATMERSQQRPVFRAPAPCARHVLSQAVGSSVRAVNPKVRGRIEPTSIMPPLENALRRSENSSSVASNPSDARATRERRESHGGRANRV